jgi:hypothetical protein
MSWVISTCIAGGEGELGLAWACGAPQRAMPPSGNRSAAMMGSLAEEGQKEALEAWSSQPEAVKGSNAWREHPGTLQQQAVEAFRRASVAAARPSRGGGGSRVTGTKDGLGGAAAAAVAVVVRSGCQARSVSKRARARYGAETEWNGRAPPMRASKHTGLEHGADGEEGGSREQGSVGEGKERRGCRSVWVWV